MRRGGGSRRRDKSEPEVIAAFRAGGATVWQLSGADIPDLAVGRYGMTHLCEVKSGTKQPTDTQAGAFRLWRGEPVAVVRNAHDATALLRQWEASQAVWAARLHAHVTSPPETPQQAPEGPP